MVPYLVHIGYALFLVAFLVRDILVLRSVLVVGQILVAAYAVIYDLTPVAGWNSAFACVNLIWVIKLIHDRREVRVPPEIQPIYERHFAAFTPREFVRWWAVGRREAVRDTRLAREGALPAALYFLLGGTARVSRAAVTVTDLGPGSFVAEMSLITGRPANADVDAVGLVEMMRWTTTDLHQVREGDPTLWTKIQSAIGLDLVQKIRRGEERVSLTP